jgi:ribokinase
MNTVVVLGSLITDLVARAPRLPYPGESLIGDDFATFLGGKGINQAIVASRMGARVTLVGRIGTDSFGDGFFPVLEHEHINSTYVERDERIGTGVSVLIIAADTGQNVIVANPRANMEVTATAVESALQAALKERDRSGEQNNKAVFLTQCETSAISFTTGLQRARAMGMITILNAAPVPREPLEDTLFSFVDILVVNEVEAAAFTQVAVDSAETARQAAERLLAKGPSNVIITLGAQGCLWCSHQADGAISHQLLPIFQVKAIDATAAGDAFCGALAASLADGSEMPEALRRARAAGAVTVTRMGAIASLPTAAEVQALLTQQPSL